LLGRVAGFENLYVGAGHFRSGLQMSAGTAEVLCELMLAGRSPMSLEDLQVERFCGGGMREASCER
jgi:glycine/D-amino acid oxidase-like deaminating enzyme